MSKKKIAIIIVVTLVVLALIAGISWWAINSQNTNNEKEAKNISKVAKLYSELKEKGAYRATIELDDKNVIQYAKKDNKAYLDTNYNWQNSKFIIKDGNSYLLVKEQQAYYTYRNNETELGKIENPLNRIKNSEYKEGKEKIDGKEYKYEEYQGITDFLMKETENVDEQTSKTRFYFNGDKLVYIKTITGDYQEILKVNISYTVDDKLFEIPAEYKEA